MMFHVFNVLQETDNWEAPEMEVGNCIVYGRSHDETAIFVSTSGQSVSPFLCWP